MAALNPQFPTGQIDREMGGDKGVRTPDLPVANGTLSQLSYIPENRRVR